MQKQRLFRLLRRAVLISAAAGVLLAAAIWFFVPDPLRDVVHWPVSSLLLDKDGAIVHARLSAEGEWCFPVPLEEMGEWLPKVLVAVEDKRFYSHGGVDLLALGRAVVQNTVSGRVVSGASTISSQLVRLSQPRARTFGTKILEFVGAWKLEQHLTKEEILEYYLNRAPFGGPIRGVEAAARMYFGKRAKELSLGEAALLVGMLKGPTAYRPDRNPKAALKRRQHIIRQVAELTEFPKDLTSLALDEPLPVFQPRMPNRAWHFADIAFAALPVIGGKPMGGVIRSTLDMSVQHKLETVLMDQLRDASLDMTAAGVVIDNQTASIVAYVGNVRFDAVAGREWVDCAVAPRSPGSTLKPFIYLDAMERGLIIPATLLADTPLQLGGEAPRNFDSRYRGPVTVAQSLADSLNVPVVRVLRMIGVKSVLHKLRTLGFSFLQREDTDYGDSLALGAGEISLLELARAYTTLANLGMDRGLAFCMSPEQARQRKYGVTAFETYGEVRAGHISGKRSKKQDAVEEYLALRRQLYSFGSNWSAIPSGLALGSAMRAGNPAKRLYNEGAAFLVAEILKDPGRLPFIIQVSQARDNSYVAFKTGTSYGLRDAWTAAYCPQYTVVTWFGKAGGGADSKLLGLGIAAPAAIEVIRELTAHVAADKSWYTQPESVAKNYVCGLSGAALSSFCPSKRLVWFLPAVWRTVPCSMHVKRGGKTALVWPPELEDYHRKRFTGKDLSRRVSVVSPLPGASYMITPGIKTQPVALMAEGVTYPVHWYVDGEYVGLQEQAHLPLYVLPTAGDRVIALLDAEERTATVIMHAVDLGEKAKKEEMPLLE